MLVAAGLLVVSCQQASTAELDRAREKQQALEVELAKTKQELADVKAELAELKGEKKGTGEAAEGSTSDKSTSQSTSGRAYTPAKSSATRNALMNAARSAIGWSKLFKVNKLRAKDGWAFGSLEQYDPSSDSRYESFIALWRKTGGSWRVVWTGSGADIEDIESSSGTSIEKWLQNRYGAPPEIF